MLRGSARSPSKKGNLDAVSLPLRPGKDFERHLRRGRSLPRRLQPLALGQSEQVFELTPALGQASAPSVLGQALAAHSATGSRSRGQRGGGATTGSIVLAAASVAVAAESSCYPSVPSALSTLVVVLSPVAERHPASPTLLTATLKFGQESISPTLNLHEIERFRGENADLRQQLEDRQSLLSRCESQAERAEQMLASTEARMSAELDESRGHQEELEESLRYCDSRCRESDEQRDEAVERLRRLEATVEAKHHEAAERRAFLPPMLPVERRTFRTSFSTCTPAHSSCCASMASESPVSAHSASPSPMLGESTSPQVRLRCLYAAPLLLDASTTLPRLNAKAEIKAIKKASAGAFEVEVGVASVASLRQAVTEPGVWLHLCIHSTNKGQGMLLEEQDPVSDVHSAQAHVLWLSKLEELLSVGGGASIPFLFLSACEAEPLARAFRAAGVQHVVCCLTPVRDTAAHCFAHYLYHALANRRSLGDAFAIAACTAKCSGDVARYGLLSDGNLWLTSPSAGTPLRHMAAPSTAPLPRELEDFVGRQKVINEVLSHLKHRRVVVLHCEAPLGLTATLVELAHYVTSPGRMFSHPSCCAFFPHEAPGGLLIVDDADGLLDDGSKDQLRSHLAADGAKLVLGCHSARSDILLGGEKAVHVPLPPLSAAESARLFLQRCHRPLLAADLLSPEELGGEEDPHRVVSGPEALMLLRRRIAAFAGDPGKVRRAAELVRPGSPLLRGDLTALAASPALVQGAPGRALARDRRAAEGGSRPTSHQSGRPPIGPL